MTVQKGIGEIGDCAKYYTIILPRKLRIDFQCLVHHIKD